MEANTNLPKFPQNSHFVTNTCSWACAYFFTLKASFQESCIHLSRSGQLRTVAFQNVVASAQGIRQPMEYQATLRPGNMSSRILNIFRLNCFTRLSTVTASLEKVEVPKLAYRARRTVCGCVTAWEQLSWQIIWMTMVEEEKMTSAYSSLFSVSHTCFFYPHSHIPSFQEISTIIVNIVLLKSHWYLLSIRDILKRVFCIIV